MAAPTTWNIDTAHSDAEVAVRHMMISTVKGHFAAVAGTVLMNESDPAASTVDVTIPLASIDTRDPKRDAHLKSADFFDAEKFPAITFKSTRVSGDLQGTFTVVGNLSMHGVTRPVTLEVEAAGRGKDPWGGEVAGFSARTKVNRKDFGLEWNVALETGGVLVGDEVKISLEVELKKQAAQAVA